MELIVIALILLFLGVSPQTIAGLSLVFLFIAWIGGDDSRDSGYN